MAPEPLISAQSVRIDEGGVPVVDRLTVETTGRAVAMVGAPRALFAALMGLREVSGGTLRVAGVAPAEAVRAAKVAAAPLDVPMPGRWTVLRFVTESARLAGRGSQSSQAARAALEAMQITGQASVKLAGAAPAVRRATMLASALATGAETLLLEDFSPGLPDEAARALGRVFLSAVNGHPWVLFAGRLALASPLGMEADEALVFSGASLLAAGPPAELAGRERTFSVRLSGAKAEVYAERLRGRGVTVQATTATALTVTMPPELTPRDLVLVAKDTDVVLLELAPLAPALM